MLSMYDLKHLDLLRMDVPEMVEASASVRLYTQEFKASKLDVPEWLETRQTELNRALKSKRDDQLALRMEQARQKLRSTLTREERRSEAQAELDRLEAEMNAE